jgi:ABC-type glycerol-3-phosphate transport system substrate-binding protein
VFALKSWPNLTNRRLYLTLILIVLVVPWLIGCAVSVPGASEAGSAGAVPAETGEKVTVVYWGHNFTPRVELDEKYIAEFMELNPDIEVEYEAIPAAFSEKLRTAMAAGTGPDLFAQSNGDMGTFHAQETIVPVDFETIGFNSQN